jgi:hypothetical protein
MIELLFALAAVAAPQDHPEGKAHSPACAFSTRAKDDEEPAPGVTLLPGLVTGMTKDELRDRYPQLRKRSSIGRRELAPGVSRDTSLEFSRRTNRLRRVWMGGSKSTETYVALVQNFGEPGARKIEGQYVYLPPGMGSPDSWPSDVEVFKWCLPAREILMWRRDDGFGLRLDAPTASKGR